MRSLLILFALLLVGAAAAAPSLVSTTQTSATVEGLDCGSKYRIEIGKYTPNGELSSAADSVDAETKSCPDTQRQKTVSVARCAVPDVRRRTVTRARRMLSARRCKLGRITRADSRKVRKGRIIGQSRRPGARLPRGTRINVAVSRGRR